MPSSSDLPYNEICESRGKTPDFYFIRNEFLPSVIGSDLKSEEEEVVDEEERTELLKKATEVDESFLDGPVIQFCLYYGLESLLPNFDIIILDEFHRAGATMWERKVDRLLRDNPDAKVVGFSATPVRSDGRDMRDLFFNDVAAEMLLSEAIIEGL